ncbi:MAG: hypothetical protein QNK36_19380 [Colwellia sp.]|nr:hypothetical protein [Colwellia sp.]
MLTELFRRTITAFSAIAIVAASILPLFNLPKIPMVMFKMRYSLINQWST